MQHKGPGLKSQCVHFCFYCCVSQALTLCNTTKILLDLDLALLDLGLLDLGLLDLDLLYLDHLDLDHLDLYLDLVDLDKAGPRPAP
jgi:hypothetical protein